MRITSKSSRRTIKPITASQAVTATSTRRKPVVASSNNGLSAEQNKFVNQLRRNISRQTSVMAATNTSNIMTRPDFLELLPLFVQKLLVLDVFGSVAMRSRQQLIPFFKFVSETTKGETTKGDVLSSPFVNRQGVDSNLTGRVVKNELMAEGAAITDTATLVYTPVLPGSVTVHLTDAGVTTALTDNANGNLLDAAAAKKGTINYATGVVTLTATPAASGTNSVKATYQYDNETVGPDAFGKYGAKMAKGYLTLDEINLVAEAHELACYWSVYSAFAAQAEYGANIGDIAKEAAFGEITAEINTQAFDKLRQSASYKPQFNWDASPVLTGAVVPSDYLNMFKLKLGQAAASIYQATRLAAPNRLIVGSNTCEYIKMINGFVADASTDNVGPYFAGTLDQFKVYVDPNYDPDTWVMACKSDDIRRSSALFGEYMPIMNTDALGFADTSVQQGFATMFASEIVNPATVVSGKILGTF